MTLLEAFTVLEAIVVLETITICAQQKGAARMACSGHRPDRARARRYASGAQTASGCLDCERLRNTRMRPVDDLDFVFDVVLDVVLDFVVTDFA